MENTPQIELPVCFKISFNKLLSQYEKLVDDNNELIADNAKRILKIGADYPKLREGFTDLSLLEIYKSQIKTILHDSFNPILTHNEIKAASIPFGNTIFNLSERFKKIIGDAGEGFELKIKNMPIADIYIVACSIILNTCYGYDINFKRPFYYEIPNKQGVLEYYKILYNADFSEIIPTDLAKPISQEDYDELLDNFNNIDLWKEKFPPNSYIFKGFVISNIFNVTDDQSISNIKSALISKKDTNKDYLMKDFYKIFQSFLGIKDLRVGFSAYNEAEDSFEHVYGEGITSFLLNDRETNNCKNLLCDGSYNYLLKENKFYTVSDVDRMYELSKGNSPEITALKEQGIKSAILAPIANNDELLGILELVSSNPKILNSINANKLIDIMPFIVASVLRSKREEQNLIEAVIQQECTSIHPSVYWKFEREAKNFIKAQFKGHNAIFNKISFEDIYPLYGQIDIKGSSEARNWATQNDLTLQLKAVKNIIEIAFSKESLPIYEQYIFQVTDYLEALNNYFKVDSEQQILGFLRYEINPLFEHLRHVDYLKDPIHHYMDSIDNKLKGIYIYRKNYDETISLINKRMASILDKKQVDAQNMYPHFFERFKTDGVEHTMYIGEAIAKEETFNIIYLYNLRLWQLQVMCEMENEYYQMKSEFPMQLDVASMILVFNQPLSISFRMDEKQFDVDGTYNARYEIVKKRVDKAFIKGTKQRVTKKGKITIIYSQKEDEIEYLRYIKFLQSKNYLDEDIEILELQDLQAVTGLKAIRVSILYHKDDSKKEFYTYDDLMKELKA
ncbi:GAF domain-containing protein [Confluentibacter sediminis]|uniref:GAF domain-containing protein n=1 Tax=Confluentibacter sediminis TaxID=2219045 RepID=UPI000DAEC27A|nr:GAF domain-containing protein [Confluentibacter sediminis]